MDVEGGLIASVLHGEPMTTALERKVTVDWFEDDEHKSVWRYMMRHYQTYGTQPTQAVVAQAYPAYKVPHPGQPVEYFINVLAEKRSLATIMDGLQQMSDIAQVPRPERLVELQTMMQDTLQQAALESASVRFVSAASEMQRLVALWKSGTAPMGLTYGFDALDTWTRGIKPGQFIVLTGHPKSRKSYTLLYSAMRLNGNGYPILFVTFEMTNEEQMERFISLDASVPYDDVMRRTLSPLHYKQISRKAKVKEMLPDFTMVEDPYGYSTVTALQALVKERSPAVLYIDGVYFMTDEETGMSASSGETKPLTNISRSLKRLAKTEKIAVVVTTQQLMSKTKKGVTSLYGIGYTSGFAQDADVVVGVESVEGEDAQSVIRLLANRSGGNVSNWFNVIWDMHKGDVLEMYAPSPSPGAGSATGSGPTGGAVEYEGTEFDE